MAAAHCTLHCNPWLANKHDSKRSNEDDDEDDVLKCHSSSSADDDDDDDATVPKRAKDKRELSFPLGSTRFFFLLSFDENED